MLVKDTSTTEIYTLSLHDALPIWKGTRESGYRNSVEFREHVDPAAERRDHDGLSITKESRFCGMQVLVGARPRRRSEEHTSELQSQSNLVCRLLLEKKKITSQ